MKKYIILTVLSIFIVTVQSSFIPLLEVKGVVPNLPLLVVVSYSFIFGSYNGTKYGFFMGVLADICYGLRFGFNIGVFTFIGYIFGIFTEKFYKKNLFIPMIISIASSFIYGLLKYMFYFLLKGNTDIVYFLTNVIVYETIYNLLLIYFIYFSLYYTAVYLNWKQEEI